MKKIAIGTILFFIIYIGISYNNYNAKKKILHTFYEENYFNLSNLINDIAQTYFITGKLPTNAELKKRLMSIDTIFFKENNFKFSIDTSNKHILAYSFFPSNSDNNLKYKIDARFYRDYKDYKQGFNFTNYLLNKKYNTLMLDFKYDSDYFCSNTQNIFPYAGENMNNEEKKVAFKKLKNLIRKVGLTPINYNNTSIDKLRNIHFLKKNYVIFIFNNNHLINMCDTINRLDSQKIEKLRQLIIDSMPNYKHLRFTLINK